MAAPPSNRRLVASPREAPQEPFKRAVAGAMRAMAKTPELDVAFAADRPSLIVGPDGAKARLTEPPRKLAPRDAAILRGQSDSLALRLACHDETLHRRFAPETAQARVAYDALEQARVESIGARRMAGVAANISAMLEDRFQRGRSEQIQNREDAPIEDALALMVRERLTGLEPPPSGARIVELWKDFIEERAGQDLNRLSGAVEDQRH